MKCYLSEFQILEATIDIAYRILITVCFQQAEWKSNKDP